MTFNFDSSSFSLDQAGLELSLNDFSFDPAQASQVQQRLQQQEQRRHQQQLQQQNHQHLQKLLLRDDPSQSLAVENQAQSQQSMNESASNAVSGAYTFRSTLAVDMMNPASASASTTPVFQTHPDKVNNGGGLVGQSIQHQIQQQHRQQQLLLQQQQQHQQQQLLIQQQQQLQQFPQSQAQVPKEGARSQLLTPAGSEYYATDYSQYMSPLDIQPATTATETTTVMADQFEEEEVQFTPLISPAITPAHPYSNVPHPMSTSNEIFSPLTSPALQPHRTSQIDYVSFSGQNFNSLPMQFQQAHQTQQQQMQQQLQQFQSQSQPQAQPQSDPSQALQQQPQFQQQQQNDLMQQQLQANPGIGTKHARVDAQNSSLMGQRPSMKRRTTVERAVAGLIPVLPRSTAGPIRNALPKSSPALRPLASHPVPPVTMRKPTTGAGRSRSASAAASVSPMVMHFPGNGQPTPSPILNSTSQNGTPSYPQSQPSPSPHLVSNMNQLSMMPPSPALFALPASSMIPPHGSPMTLPSQQSHGLVQTSRQLSISHPVQSQQQKQQPLQDNLQTANQQQPLASQTSQPPSSAALLKSTGYGANAPLAPLAPAPGSNGEVTTDDNGSIPPTSSPSGSGTSKSSLAPVTPASLMNMSGSESTPTSSPKFGANTKARSLLAKSNQGSNEKSRGGSKSNSSSSNHNSSSGSRRSGSKRHSHGVIATAGTLAPRTPGATAILAMPPPSSAFTLISPALKPTLMPQPSLHRGSIGGQTVLVSPRSQPMLVSPSLKPWLPGVSTTEVMARLASKSNYQNILDGDHTALGLSYNTDLHSGIELRRTSHKAAEQKRRDSLKHCFEDLRQMIPNIVDKAPSKVFLLKKSFDYICSLKSDLAQQDLVRAKIQAQEAYRLQALEAWMATLPENIPRPDMDLWKMNDEDLAKVTAKEASAARIAAEIAELSAAAVEAARVGNQPGGNKEGKSLNMNGGKSGGSSGSGKGSTRLTGQGQSASTNSNNHDNRGNIDDDDDDEESDDGDAPAAVPNAASDTNGSESRPKSNPRNVTDPLSSGLQFAANGPTRCKAPSNASKGEQGNEEGVNQGDDDEQEEEEEEEEEEDEEEDEDDEDYSNDQGVVQDQEMTDVSDRPV